MSSSNASLGGGDWPDDGTTHRWLQSVYQNEPARLAAAEACSPPPPLRHAAWDGKAAGSTALARTHTREEREGAAMTSATATAPSAM